MVEPTANFLLETLRDLLIEEAKFISSVKYEVKKVEEDLTTIHAWLKDADANKNPSDSATFQNFIKRLKDLAFEAENVLETYAVEVESKRGVKGLKKKLRRYMCIVCECYNVHKVGNEIEVIRSRLADLTAEQSRIAGGGHGSSDSADQERKRLLRLTFEHEGMNQAFVGMQKDIDDLVSLVKDDSPGSRSTISICGMGGLGKTTLARQIYHHQEVKKHFDTRAWVCLTQQFQPDTILRDIFTQIDANKANEALTIEALTRGLRQVMVQRKCLVVMDDIWEDDHWKIIERAFPKENCKVVLTTRFQNIASPEHSLHKLGYVSEDEGWELLWKTALLCETDVAVERRLEDIGRQIVRKCGCLPLAISVIGGILRQKQPTFAKWEQVSNHMDAYLNHGGEGTGEYKEIKQILDLSYNVLPYHLKPCFLYLSCFPEGEEIDTEQLYLLWMAEGLISSEERSKSENLRDVAERYLTELALRCMVQVERRDANMACKQFASCRVHDLMRELCSSQAEKENFIKRVDVSKHENDNRSSVEASIHRLAINLVGDGAEPPRTYNLQKVKNLRSLLAFRRNLSLDNRNYFENSRHLKILVMDGFSLDGNLEQIGKLIYLRHLSFLNSYIEELPRHVYKFPCLQTLDLRVRRSIKLRNVIWMMKKLRHLFLPGLIEVIGGGKLRVNGLNQLETLEGINSETACIEDIIKLKNLRQLFAVLKGENNMESKDLESIYGCDALRETRLRLKRCNLVAGILRKVIMIRSLFSLEIEDSDLTNCVFPSYTQGQGMYENLVQLTIRYSEFGQSKMMFCANSFPKLKILHLLHLNLREWEVESGAIPELRELFIQGCEYLERLPDEVLSISTLQVLRVKLMSQQFNTHARQVRHRMPNLTVFEIGVEKDVDSLVSMMKDDSPHSPSVISICGMGGLGKTTLARQIYNHQDVQRHFDDRAWVCLTVQFHAESILSEIIRQIDGNKPEGQTLSELVPRLYNVLEQRKCLIVMDDIWKDDHWKMIEPAIPKGNCKVVLTTRSKDVASPKRFLYMLDILTDEEGLELFRKIAFPD